MAFFQNSVLQKHIKDQDQQKVQLAFERFSGYFHNPQIQQNIRNSKEEQFQEGFLRELFGKVLGYTLNPDPDFNLTTELKNTSNSKKADGAILIDGKAVAVIELKGTETTDLTKIEVQAFGYKNNQANCTYVITSNFEKLRFYIDNAVDFVEFDLFRLNKEQFQLLYLCLAIENIKGNVPKHLKDESVSKENNITKELYRDYSNFKRDLFNSLVELNPQFDKLLLFKKTQKLLDRFLFIFFAEDRLLLPTNLIRRINLEWENLQKMRIPVSLYDRYKIYFNDLNTGAKVTLPAFGKKTGDAIEAEFEIFAYNGGLFLPDEILDAVQIDDQLLYNHSHKMSDYDFQSEVDVNILGHIFENSLNEIDEIKSEIEGNVVDKTKTRRKKDGVFYTPKYITKYIVDNTVGKLCEEKKTEFGIVDEEFAKGRKNRNKTTIQKLDQSLHDYRDWLLQITICDPACGSGAFLNQALEFLIQQHSYIDELETQLLGTSIGFPGAELHILENNIYGVDLNDESVEIAKLSLWLRTAQKGRKLNSLNNNIKCGNSLIDNPEVAGDKAFSWEKEFPEVFGKGGFDVVIGNPPYVFGGNEGINESHKVYFKNYFQTGAGKINLFTLFIEKGHQIMKTNGEFSYIIPNTFLRVTSYNDSRRFFVNNFQFRELADLGDNVFAGAVTTAIILVATKVNPDLKKSVRIIKNLNGDFSELKLSDLIKNNFVITSNISENKRKILNKITTGSTLLGTETKEMIFGVVITKNKDEVVFDKPSEGLKPFLEGKDIASYFIRPTRLYLNYNPKLLHRSRSPKVFESPEKLLVQRITGGRKPLKVAYDNNMFYNKESINNIILNDKSKYKPKFILALLNSSLINWFYNNQFTNESNLTVNISKEYLSQIPIKGIKEQEQFIEGADKIMLLNKEFFTIALKFNSFFKNAFLLNELSTKLEKWYELSFTDFIKELNKAIKTVKGTSLTKKDEFEWMDLFEENKQKAVQIKAEIDKTDQEIDAMVYALYGLTEEEIRVVEGN